MYVQGQNKVYYKVKMNSGRGSFSIVIGIFCVIFSLLLFGGGMVLVSHAYGSDRTTVGVMTMVMVILFFEWGGSLIVNGAILNEVKLIVYDGGIYGNSAKINPFIGVLSKSIPFDMTFQEINGVRIEHNILIIHGNGSEHSFVFPLKDCKRIQQLIVENKNKLK